MNKLFNNKYFFAFVVLLLILAYFFEYLFSNLIINNVVLLTIELLYDFAVLYISLRYVSISEDFQKKTWIKPKAGMYILITLIVFFAIKTIYDLVAEFFL